MTSIADVSPRWPEDLAAQIASPASLQRAWDHLHRRAPGPGIDRVTVQQLAPRLHAHLHQLSAQLLSGAWRPSPGLRVRLASDPERKIAVPTLSDRIVQRAIASQLAPRYDASLDSACWAYRPGRSVAQALDAIASQQRQRGYTHAARTDITQFFDRIDRARLLELLAQDQLDRQVLAWIKRLLNVGALEGVSHTLPEGVGQGSALSPLLSNLYLRGVDAAMREAGFPYWRYADDILIMGPSLERVDEGLVKLGEVLGELSLTLNLRKTWRGPCKRGFVYLGAAFYEDGVRASASALDALRERAEDTLRVAPSMGWARDALPRLVRLWSQWYGPLAPGEAGRLALLWAALLDAPQDAPDALGAWARSRVEAPLLTQRADGALHVELALLFAQAAQAGAPHAHALALAAAHDLRAATSQPLEGEAAERLSAWLEVDPSQLASLSEPALLARALTQRGAQAIALRVIQLAGLEPSPPADAPPLPDALPALLLALAHDAPFHAMEERDARGHWRFSAQPRALDQDAICRHLQGRGRRAVYLLDVHERARCFALHAFAPRVTDPLPEGWEQDHERARLYLVALMQAGARLALPSLLEDTGVHGFRLWFFLAQPTPRPQIARLVDAILQGVDSPPAPVVLQCLPHLTATHRQPGPYAALPLGTHPRTSCRAMFIDASGAPRDPVQALTTRHLISQEVVHALALIGPEHPRERARDDEALLKRHAQDPVTQVILQRCEILRALAKKASQLGILEPDERASLFEVFGHLPAPQHKRALATLLHGCSRSEPDVIARRVQQLGPYPLGCPKLKQRHAGLTAPSGCDCRFAPLPSGVYPTPLLHGLTPQQLPCFRGKTSRRAPLNPASQAATTPPTPADARPEPLPTMPATPQPLPSPTQPPRPSAPPSSAPDPSSEIEHALARLLNCRRALDDAQRGLDAQLAQLRAQFKARGATRVRVAQGWLVHRPGEHPEFIIELG